VVTASALKRCRGRVHAVTMKPRVTRPSRTTTGVHFSIRGDTRCLLNWLARPPAGVDDRHWWNRIRDNELEELVVVLFAKVAMPTIDAVGPYHLKTAGTPASPNSIFTTTPLRRQSKSVISSPITLKLVPLQVIKVLKMTDLRLMGPTDSQNAKPGNYLLYVQTRFSSSLWLFLSIRDSLLWDFDFNLLQFKIHACGGSLHILMNLLISSFLWVPAT
jgi:hypothetical protein